MKSDSRPSVDELFAVAVALEERERSRFLDSHCGPDTAMRAQLEELLQYHDAAGDFLEVPPITSLPEPALIERAAAPETTPARIGHFRIERVLGMGGMGRVYLGESEQPRRWVALKVVRSGMGSESLRKRFEQEAQVVALLQHPGIAQLYEAGTADTGDGAQPYFAMEYVDGPTLTEYAKRRELPRKERLELFCRVCDAVEHAHRRGVVHRDLKPGNILVDATGQPKILDFGVARLTDPETRSGTGVATTTLHTQAGQLIGTLSYMSPEQVGGNPGEVDARADVYSLGVILFEMLAGRLPHNVSSSSIPEAIRAIKEDAPTSLSAIDRGLRGDIETIVGRALEKDASRRYQSAAELAGDIRRSLRDEPIVARPPSTWYQLGKFAKRNKALVGGTVATIVALSGGLVAAVWQARETEISRKSAEEALKVSEQINQLMQQLFMSPEPDSRMGKDVTVMQVLERSSKHIDRELADEPHVRAVLHRTIGDTYRSLTAYSQAEEHLRAAYAIHLELYGEAHEETIQSMTSLVLVLSQGGKRKEALDLATREWEIAQRFFDKDDPERLVMAANLAVEKVDTGDWKGAMELQSYVLEERKRLLPENHPSVLLSMHQLGRTLGRTGRVQDAVKLQREAVAGYRASGRPLDENSFALLMGLANTLLDVDQDDEADALAEELLEEGRELFHPEHNALLTARNIRGQVMLHRKQFVEAEAEYRELVRLQQSSEVPALDGLVKIMNNLAEAFRHQGKLDEAEVEFRAAIKIMDEHEMVPDRMRILILNNLALVLRLKKDFKASLPIYKELVEVSERVLAPDDMAVAVSKYGYGVVLLAERRPEECEAQLQGAYDIAIKSFNEQDESVITIMRSFVNLYELWQKKPGIEEDFRKALQERAGHWRAKLPEKYRKE